jgi:hypothetical protein
MPENDGGLPADDSLISLDEEPITDQSQGNYRSAVTRAPASRVNGRTAVGRRVRDLFGALMARLGQPSDVIVQADVLALAELKAAAEVARLRLLEGDERNSNEIVRLENLVRRAEARVGLAAGAAGKPDDDGTSWRDLFVGTEEEETQ